MLDITSEYRFEADTNFDSQLANVRLVLRVVAEPDGACCSRCRTISA